MAWLDAVGALPDKTNNGQTLAAARTLFMASGYSSTGTSPDSGDSTGIIWVKVGTMCRLLWQETNVYDSKTINLPFNFSPGYFFGSQTGAPAGWASWVNGTVGHNTVTLHVGKQSGGTSGVAASGDGFSASMMVEGVLAT
ncbi:hypothetical protein AA12717_1417 [Gluconacetobacter sacchari DSM 12717]|nr:hypothetical protein AA12717_1417 [Gluconacetobacter sacchari DSM 12717]